MSAFTDKSTELEQGRVDIRNFDGVDADLTYTKHDLGIIMDALYYRITEDYGEDYGWADANAAMMIFYDIKKTLFVTPEKLDSIMERR